MTTTSSRVGRRVLRVLTVELLVGAAALLPLNAPAPVSVVRAPAQALVAFRTAGASTVSVQHHLLGRFPGPGERPVYRPVDEDLTGVGPDEVVRVRFRLHNGSADTPVTITPLLQFRRQGGTFARVPDKALPNGVLHTRLEWVRPSDGRPGTVVGPESASIPADKLLMSDDSTEVQGHRSAAANPDITLTLPAGASTEQEFTLGLGAGAQFETTYELRLTDGGAPLGDDLATLTTGRQPPTVLSPGQRDGAPATPQRNKRVSADGVEYRLTYQPALFRPNAATLYASTTVITGVHGPYSTTPDQCAVCHRTHTAAGPNLLTKDQPQSALCFTCHDGTGSSYNVKSEYTGATANNPADRAYFQHDALSTSTHTLASQEEFAGVTNRHSECGDCHNPHQSNDADATQSGGAWTASGRLQGVSGVAVTNGAAGTAPSYTFLDGVASPVTAEYQLCFKCHSGYTTLPSNSGFTPSRWDLDKGVEFNLNNGSYHPVEGPGTNTTPKMSDSLAGTSPYKLWNFSVGSTIRCTQCHAAGSLRSTSPAPGSKLPPHTSSNRGILLAPYKDRVLNTTWAPYSSANFALCLMCHGEVSFANETSTGTNYFYHGKHLTRLAGLSTGGTDIDTPGAGQGNAICAECHFRIHSPVTMKDSENLGGQRLVSFAPNVTGFDASNPKPAWARIGSTGGSCSLTCHGFPHDGESYS